MVTSARRAVKSGSRRRWATTTLVSRRALPVAFIDPFAAFLDSFLHLVSGFLREASSRAGENSSPFFLADPLQTMNIVCGQFQLVRRQRLKVLDDIFQRAHGYQSTPATRHWQAACRVEVIPTGSACGRA